MPLDDGRQRRSIGRFGFILNFLALILVRLPSLIEPAGADRGLYAYVGQRMLEGDWPYRDAWDQKPPAIHATYALMFGLWPSPGIINITDLAVAVVTVLILLGLGRALGTASGAGTTAALLFLFLSNQAFVRRRPSPRPVRGLHRICGFRRPARDLACPTPRGRPAYGTRAFAVARRRVAPRCRHRLQVQCGDVRLARVSRSAGLDRRCGTAVRHACPTSNQPRAAIDVALFPPGFAAVGHSGPGCAGAVAARDLCKHWPLQRALSGHSRVQRVLFWRNVFGSLAFSAPPGVVSRATRAREFAVVARWPGLRCAPRDDPRAPATGRGFRVGRGRVSDDRDQWQPADLSRSGESWSDQKCSALAIDQLADYLRTHTTTADRVLVFGFSPWALVSSELPSASRFFWSRLVIVGFNAGSPGCGPAGLLAELERSQPRLVVLQRNDWPDTEDSVTFFLQEPRPATWLRQSYGQIADEGNFLIWHQEGA